MSKRVSLVSTKPAWHSLPPLVKKGKTQYNTILGNVSVNQAHRIPFRRKLRVIAIKEGGGYALHIYPLRRRKACLPGEQGYADTGENAGGRSKTSGSVQRSGSNDLSGSAV